MIGNSLAAKCRITTRIVLAAGITGSVGVISNPAIAAPPTFTFTKIAATGTTDPSGKTFGSFDDPVVSGTTVAFRGFDTTGVGIGVYTGAGGAVSKIADQKSTDPSSGKFTNFGTVSIAGNTVEFTGTYSASGYQYTDQGLYSGTGGTLTKLVDVKTTVPGSTAKFTDFQGSLTGSQFAFLGTSSLGSYIYGLLNGTITTLVNNTTADPSGGKFTGLMYVSSDVNNNILFQGYCSTTAITGIYEKSGSAISKIVDTKTVDPSGGGNFFGFGAPVFAGANVAFLAVNNGITAKGVYEKVGSQVIILADTSTPDPLGGTFGYLSDPAASADGVTFLGLDQSEQNPCLMTTIGGALSPVITTGTTLGGKKISNITLSQRGMDGYNIAFHAYFTDGTEAIYLAVCTSP